MQSGWDHRNVSAWHKFASLEGAAFFTICFHDVVCSSKYNAPAIMKAVKVELMLGGEGRVDARLLMLVVKKSWCWAVDAGCEGRVDAGPWR